MIKHLMLKTFNISIKIHLITGFTLAEVLITLLITGVVASLTIPGIINSTNKAEYVTKLKKEQAVLMQAFNSIKADNGGSILNDSNFNSSIGGALAGANAMNEFATKLNVVKNCGSGMGCWYTSPLKFLGGDIAAPNYDLNMDASHGKAILADGTMMLVEINNSKCTATGGIAPVDSPIHGSVCGTINIDINGSLGPNQRGRDSFVFWITQTGIYPVGVLNDGNVCNINSFEWWSSNGCAGIVLSKGAMNY